MPEMHVLQARPFLPRVGSRASRWGAWAVLSLVEGVGPGLEDSIARSPQPRCETEVVSQVLSGGRWLGENKHHA